MHQNGVYLLISGDSHSYERFAPQDFTGRFDSARGIRQFIVGTGGTTLRTVGPARPNSEVPAGVPANRISDIVRGARSLTAETAILLGERFGTDPRFWMNLQVNYDLAQARGHEHPAVESLAA